MFAWLKRFFLGDQETRPSFGLDESLHPPVIHLKPSYRWFVRFPSFALSSHVVCSVERPNVIPALQEHPAFGGAVPPSLGTMRITCVDTVLESPVPSLLGWACDPTPVVVELTQLDARGNPIAVWRYEGCELNGIQPSVLFYDIDEPSKITVSVTPISLKYTDLVSNKTVTIDAKLPEEPKTTVSGDLSKIG